jgi:3-phenylpropionate/trans-cinnamate dioxygenase ferredoxin reductase subunit
MAGAGIVIIGGGHGGSQIAASLREKGYDGPLTLVSDENEIPYQRPPLSKAYLKDPGHDLLPLRPRSYYDKNGIALRLGTTATGIDRPGKTVALASGEALAYDKLALAIGSRPRVPQIAGLDLDGVFYLRNANDARWLRSRLPNAESVVIVGGGFIGLEIAATARLLGKAVTVLEAADRLMGRVVHPHISTHFLNLHQGWGSDIRFKTPIGAILGEGGKVVAVETASGERIAADVAVIGIGIVPNVEMAAAAGLAIDNGILVDDFMATSDPDIASSGDCGAIDHWGR